LSSNLDTISEALPLGSDPTGSAAMWMFIAIFALVLVVGLGVAVAVGAGKASTFVKEEHYG